MQTVKYPQHIAVAAIILAIGTHSAGVAQDLPDPASLNAQERQILEDFQRRAGQIAPKPPAFRANGSTPMPSDFSPWWIRAQKSSLGDGGTSQHITVEDLYVRALQNSTQIKVFSDLPLIRETAIQEAKGAFDTRSFVEGKFDRTNDPVGNVLTTGGASRFKQDEYSLGGGLTKKVISGAEVSVRQEISRLDNNSIYYVPNPQATSQLVLSVVQPVLKGGGVAYNRSIMEIAKLDSEVAMSEFIRQSESHLLEITRSYWALYAARVTYLQKVKTVDETARVVDELRGRLSVDAQKSQLLRAQSALAARRADLVRTEAAVRNAQDRLRALTNDPAMLDSPNAELVPDDTLLLEATTVDVRDAVLTALDNRPEINQAFLQLRAATVREKMQRNELMPELNLIVEGTLGGLDNGEVGGAYSREYTTGSPGWAAGFMFSFPLENNIARAQLERRRIELRQQLNQLRTTVDTVMMEVKISAREVATALREMQAKFQSVQAFIEDLDTIEARRPLLSTSSTSEIQMSDYLDGILDAQDRRSTAEEEFILSAANYQISIVNLERAKGKLLAYSDVEVVRTKDEKKLPLLYLEKAGGGAKNVRESKY